MWLAAAGLLMMMLAEAEQETANTKQRQAGTRCCIVASLPC
jgi:hypothetical protein